MGQGRQERPVAAGAATTRATAHGWERNAPNCRFGPELSRWPAVDIDQRPFLTSEGRIPFWCVLYRQIVHMLAPIFFLCPDQDELAYLAHKMVLETTSRDEGSELSGATVIPQMTVVADLTGSED